MRKRNPFDVQTPENLSTEEMISLFVSGNTDYWKIAKEGHTFITGPRGAGKSMIFRFMEPDCQCRHTGKNLSELEYYAAYIPVKETDLNLPELLRLKEVKHATFVLNEHALITHIATKFFVSLRERAPIDEAKKEYANDYARFYNEELSKLLARSGWQKQLPKLDDKANIKGHLETTIWLFDDIFGQCKPEAYQRYSR